MQEIAKLSADRIRQELTVSETIVSELGCSYQLSAAVFTPAQKQEYINQRVEAYGMVRGKLIGSNGICAADGTDYNDREYFKRSMQGEVVVSDPVIAKTDGKLSVIISAPVYEGGDKDGEIIGVVFVVPDPEFLNDICAAISISEHSGCYLLGSTGITIAHSDSAIAQEQKNNIELSQTDSSLKGIAKIEQQMLKGETGYGTYFRKGAYTLQAYAPIDGTDGWMVAVDAPVTDFLGSVVIGIIIGAAIGVIAVAYSIYKAQQIGQREYLRNKMNNGTKLYMLVEEKSIGVVSVTKGLIEDLYILPDMQNMGYGTKLLLYAVGQCTDTPTLWILENNINAERLYRRIGFKETGRKNAITNKLDEIEFALT